MKLMALERRQRGAERLVRLMERLERPWEAMERRWAPRQITRCALEKPALEASDGSS